jgi:hypothetical protein
MARKELEKEFDMAMKVYANYLAYISLIISGFL